jgi:hypothetical protein
VSKPRIENAEVVAFRLKVPLTDLERLAQTAGAKKLQLTLEYDGAELVLASGLSDSALRFRPIGTDAMLSELAIARDEGGAFFKSVVLALARKFRGDLHLRLVWNEGERNTHGNWEELKVSRGEIEDLAQPYAPATVSSGPAGEQMDPGEPDPEPPLTEEERELSELLARARTHWDEYQRLKAGK